jgi:hypothetical protein
MFTWSGLQIASFLFLSKRIGKGVRRGLVAFSSGKLEGLSLEINSYRSYIYSVSISEP